MQKFYAYSETAALFASEYLRETPGQNTAFNDFYNVYVQWCNWHAHETDSRTRVIDQLTDLGAYSPSGVVDGQRIRGVINDHSFRGKAEDLASRLNVLSQMSAANREHLAKEAGADAIHGNGRKRTYNMSEAARAARREYQRAYAKKHPDKMKAMQERYWEKKAREAEIAAQEAAE